MMKKSMRFLATVAVVGVAMFAGNLAATANAHDGYYPSRHRGNGGYSGYGYRGRGFYQPSVGRNQIFLSTPSFSIGFGVPVQQFYRARPVYVPVYPQQHYHPGCGW